MRREHGWALLGAALVVVGGAWSQSAPVVATINGETIKLDEVDALLRLRPSVIPVPAAHQRQMKLEVLSGLIDELLLRQYFKQHGPALPPSAIEPQLATLKAGLAKANLTFEQYLRDNHQTEAQLRQQMLTLTQLSKLAESKCSDAELEKYYVANKDYFDKVTVRASHIVIRVGPSATEAERLAAKQKLLTLRADLLANKVDFTTAVRTVSQCPSSARGGDVGTFTRKWMDLDEAFVQAAFALKVDELSDVVATDFGLHLIKVTERNAGTPSSFDKCKEEVRESWIEDFRQTLLGQIRRSAQIEITLP
jgi:peptidyl-prolyl cis-trans isomerase C